MFTLLTTFVDIPTAFLGRTVQAQRVCDASELEIWFHFQRLMICTMIVVHFYLSLLETNLWTLQNDQPCTAASKYQTCHPPFPSQLFQGEVYFFVQSWLGILVFFRIQHVSEALAPFCSSLTPLQVILQARLYALYRGSKIILVLMGSVKSQPCRPSWVSSTHLHKVCLLTLYLFLSIHAHESRMRGHIFGNIVSNEVLTGLYICAIVQGPSLWENLEL